MWRCERHIPTSKMYPAIIAKCVACGFPRPDEAYRPPMNPEEPKPVVRVVSPPPPPVEPEPPVVTWEEGPEPELDEEPGIEEPEVSEPVKRGIELLDKAIQDEEPQPVEIAPAPEVTKRPKDIPVTEKSKAHLCPGPKCRKVSRRNSPYCSKICSDRCLRLRKKAIEKVLTDQEIKWLNRILAVLEVWGGDKG